MHALRHLKAKVPFKTKKTIKLQILKTITRGVRLEKCNSFSF